ncbi:C-terminal helicase domain-containing protein [Helicobacter pylori]
MPKKDACDQKWKKCDFKNFDELKIDTVDAFQGEETDIIIYSTVKTYGNLSFLLDSKRLNVAISRAKENLIFVGKKSFFENLRSDEKISLALFCKSVDR